MVLFLDLSKVSTKSAKFCLDNEVETLNVLAGDNHCWSDETKNSLLQFKVAKSGESDFISLPANSISKNSKDGYYVNLMLDPSDMKFARFFIDSDYVHFATSQGNVHAFIYCSCELENSDFEVQRTFKDGKESYFLMKFFEIKDAYNRCKDVQLNRRLDLFKNLDCHENNTGNGPLLENMNMNEVDNEFER